MATILIQDGFRFFIPSLDHRPPHVHVEKGSGAAKFHLDPVVELVKSRGLKIREINAAYEIVCQNREAFIKAFNQIIP